MTEESSAEYDDEVCQHYDAQVQIRVHELEITDPEAVEPEDECDWCGGLPDILLVKSERHRLILCDECRTLIRMLAGGDAGE